MSVAHIDIDQFHIEASIDSIDTLSCVLYHSHVPVIRRILIKNKGADKTPSLLLSVFIRGCSHTWKKETLPIQPGKELNLGAIDILLDYARLEGISNRSKANLIVQINEITVYEKPMGINGFYEWPTFPEPVYQKTLACFIQPANPVIQSIINLSEGYLKEKTGFISFTDLLNSNVPDKQKHAAASIYEAIHLKYNVVYDYEPNWSYEEDSQAIRPPQQIIFSHPFAPGQKGNGIGTCIDLSLLFAACLEHIGIRPIIVVIKKGDNSYHALCGYWNLDTRESLDLFLKADRLTMAVESRQVTLIETTGFTIQKNLPFDGAVFEITNCSELIARLVFALDIAVARENRLYPIQFSWSPALTHVIDEAERIALEGKGSLLECKTSVFQLLAE